MVSAKRPVTSGFSLVEVLVAITLLSLVMTVALSALRTGLRIWGRASDEIAETQLQDLTIAMIGNQIRYALPLRLASNPGEVLLGFRGTRDTLRLVSRHSFALGPDSPPHWIELSWSADDPTRRIQAAEYWVDPQNNRPQAQPFWTGELLEVENFQLSYLPKPRSGVPGGWVEEWPETRFQLPVAVRLSYTYRARPHQVVFSVEHVDDVFGPGVY